MEDKLGLNGKPWLLSRLRSIKEKIYKNIGELETFITTDSEPIPFQERNLRTYSKIERGHTWGKAFTCSWFNFKGQVPLDVKSQHIVLIIDIDGEGLYVNEANEPISGITSKMCWVDKVQSTRGKAVIEVSECNSSGENIDIWLEGGFNGKVVLPYGTARFKKAFIAVCRDDIKDFYYDYLTLAIALVSTEDRAKKEEINQSLKRAYGILKNYSPQEIKEAREILYRVLSKENAEEGLYFTAVGHSHLDLGWLWPVRETKRKAARTFSNALKNIDKYPGYIYGASQPQQFDWIKQAYPSLFSRIRAAVESGRIELQGGMWVEADTNVPSGESLIRQIYYGKKFFFEEFNQNMKICWLPDVFGYNANLPQILKKTGIDYFMTIKLSWNEHNTFPHRTFNWFGIDGSSVLVHMPPEGDYNSGGTPLRVKRALENFPEKDVIDNALLVYGIGDGGGGPGEIHIELVKRQENLEGFPRVKFGRAIDYFERLKSSRDKLNSYNGELYLEKHQGTYTTQGRNKYYNRKIEFLLHDIEALCSFAYLKGFEYPHAFLEKTWKEALLYQFHDIIPGSSIKRVYDESRKRYQEMIEELEVLKQKILNFLSVEQGMSFINTSSFERIEYVKSANQWHLINAKPYSAAQVVPAGKTFDIKFGDNYIENEFLKATFSEKGYIISLYDKVNNMESCGEYLNRLTLYTDKWKYFNAWDIDINYHKKRKSYLKPLKSETFTDGPRVIRRNFYRHGKTTLTQDIILTSGKGYIEFDTSCDFHETFKMLRADFNPAVYSDSVKCDIQFGSFDRSTRNDTLIEKAQFEICAHKWVDLSNKEYGVSLFNDCKYGHRVKGGIISLNLLRSPVYPDPAADRGSHHFRYAFYPHRGNAFESDIMKESYMFNMAPVIVERNISFEPAILANRENIIIETVKKAEKEHAIIIRLYECFGKNTTSSISTSIEYTEAFETDMLENIISKTAIDNMSFTPFEVKTIMLRLK